MRQLRVMLSVAVLVAGAWLVGPEPGEAGELSVSLGVGFVVGGASFRVAYVGGGYAPYYYRLEAPLHYPGYNCTSYCYVGAGHHRYHAPFCPVVRHHFTRHRYAGPFYGSSHHSGHGHGRYGKRPRYRGYDGYHSGGRYRHEEPRHYRGASGHRGVSKGHGKSRNYRVDGPRYKRSSRAPGAARRTRPPRR